MFFVEEIESVFDNFVWLVFYVEDEGVYCVIINFFEMRYVVGVFFNKFKLYFLVVFEWGINLCQVCEFVVLF